MTAPRLISSRAHATLLLTAAVWSGVLPRLLAWLTVAPLSSSWLSRRRLPWAAAMCRGVFSWIRSLISMTVANTPSFSWSSTPTFSSRRSMHAMFRFKHARCKAVCPSSFMQNQLGLPPASRARLSPGASPSSACLKSSVFTSLLAWFLARLWRGVALGAATTSNNLLDVCSSWPRRPRAVSEPAPSTVASSCSAKALRAVTLSIPEPRRPTPERLSWGI
mmetsp:Transcript_15402/g.32187  ORF Transcript_15402/g.32187 Transcript_15402/m.32187 type:complete len:220 (+) Transcript_15402:765-1424(+)